MKKLLILILTIIMSQFLIGCSANKNVEFKEFFFFFVGFSENDKKSEPIHQDIILMLTNDDIQKFKDEYFTPRKIPMESPDKEKAVLFLQIPSQTSLVDSYSVESINISDNTLTVNLKKSGCYEVNGISGFNGSWKLVKLIEVDKTNLKDNMEIVVNK